MRALILDDIQHRLNVLSARYNAAGYNDIVLCRKYSEAIAALNGNRFDLISLDHDLGEFADDADYFVDGWGNIHHYTGHHVCSYMMNGTLFSDDKFPSIVVIHSVNAVASPIMVKDLLSAACLSNRDMKVIWEPFSAQDI